MHVRSQLGAKFPFLYCDEITSYSLSYFEDQLDPNKLRNWRGHNPMTWVSILDGTLFSDIIRVSQLFISNLIRSLIIDLLLLMMIMMMNLIKLVIFSASSFDRLYKYQTPDDLWNSNYLVLDQEYAYQSHHRKQNNGF